MGFFGDDDDDNPPPPSGYLADVYNAPYAQPLGHAWSQWAQGNGFFPSVVDPPPAQPDPFEVMAKRLNDPSVILNFAPMGLGIKAFHGSPHDFDAFSMDKIGTGEGNQVFGHGLYFGGNKDVANFYKQDQLQFRGQPYESGLPARATPDDIAQYLVGKRALALGPDASSSDMYGAYADAVRDALQRKNAAIGDALAGIRPDDFAWKRGKMYEVDLDADPEKMLHWDRTWFDQPGTVRDAIGADPGVQDFLDIHKMAYEAVRHPGGAIDRAKELGYQPTLGLNGWGAADPAAWPGPKGSSIYSELSTFPGTTPGTSGSSPVQASEFLRDAGLHGIRYLNGGTRNAMRDAPTAADHNYVMFDPARISILKKYGLLPFGLGASAAGLSQQDQ